MEHGVVISKLDEATIASKYPERNNKKPKSSRHRRKDSGIPQSWIA